MKSEIHRGIWTLVSRSNKNVAACSGSDVDATVRLLFGSIPNKGMDSSTVLKVLTRDVAANSKLKVHVGTYRTSLNVKGNLLRPADSSGLVEDTVSWNHGKIIAVDGTYLITGGTNLYSEHYLHSDPVHDLSMVVTGGAALTAHRYANALWGPACTYTTDLVLQKYSHHAAWENGQQSRQQLGSCPPNFSPADSARATLHHLTPAPSTRSTSGYTKRAKLGECSGAEKNMGSQSTAELCYQTCAQENIAAGSMKYNGFIYGHLGGRGCWCEEQGVDCTQQRDSWPRYDITGMQC